MKNSILFLTATVALSCLSAQAMTITFVGDSITQGGTFNSGTVSSFRYQLFKNFVDNGVSYDPMGMTVGASKGVSTASLTPDYRGFSFSNVSEAAASGRAYQYSGHAASSSYKADPGTVANDANRGPVTVKLGLENPYTETTDTYYNGSTLTTYKGDTYQSLYGDVLMDRVCIMIGINDLYDGNDLAATAGFVGEIVSAYQAYNPDVRIHLFELLPTGSDNGTGTNNKNNYAPYNAVLKEAASSWSTATSTVTVDNISTGFYAENGAMIDTAAGAHPNRQGELIVAGNIARVLGVGQRTAGLERKGAAALSSQLAWTGAASSPTLSMIVDGDSKTFTTLNIFSIAANGNLSISSELAGGRDARLVWNSTGVAREFTLSFSVKMAETGNEQNAFGLMFGNGEGAGALYVTECGILWGPSNSTTLLYGSNNIADTTHNTFSSTEDFIDITISYLGSGHEGVASGFYIWLGDQLIGEALGAVSSISAHKDKILFGDIGASWLTQAELASLSFEAGTAYAPLARSIPEPSAVGLLAGLGAVVLAGMRRRRKMRR
ncbi:MAG: SGNH/GDSL hydrolase family protein [Opitutales bacterium]|nr:SGNH/GDSL hydrolase family protein [Opitutales bacterium]